MADPQPVEPHPAVLAVVVSDGITSYLPETLRGLAEQRNRPDAVLLVDTSAKTGRAKGRTTALRTLAKETGLPLELVRIAYAPGARTFGDAVREGLVQLAEQGSGGPDLARAPWLWFLHDDSAPEPTALDELFRTGEGGPSVAMVGAKQRDWTYPDHLVSLGVTISPGGRRFTGIEDGELDQGQHDGRDDVYAVGTAGSLVRHETWDLLGGTDPALGPFGDGLDLSRRARLAGFRVVVAPRAVVRHARASYFGLRPAQARPADQSSGEGPRPDVRRSFRERRVALLHARLVDAAPLAIPFLVVAAALGALVRALGRVATKELRLAAAELAAAAQVLTRPGAVRRSRARLRATRSVPNRRLKSLRASWRDVWRVGHDRRLQAAAARRARVAPSELQVAERAERAARRRGGLLLTVVLLVALALVGFGPLLAAGPLTGGALLPISADLGVLWQRALDGWVPTGDGARGPHDPLLAVLALPTALAGGSAQAAVSGLVLGAIPLAGLGAWFAAGAGTRSVRLRVWAALTWALAPPLLLGAGQGRLGAVVAHLALPWAALGVVRALGVHRRDELVDVLAPAEPEDLAAGDASSAPAPERPVPVPVPVPVPGPRTVPGTDRAGAVAAAAGGGLALAFAAAGAPVLMPAGLIALALIALAAPRRRTYLWLVALPPVVLLAPLLLEAGRDLAGGSWRVLLADPGVPLASEPGAAYLALLTWPTTPPPWPLLPEPAAGVLPLVASGAVALVALLALLGRRSPRGSLTGWAVAAVGLAAAFGVSRVETALGAAPAEAATSVLVNGWAGPGTSVVLAGLLVAALAEADGLSGRLAARDFGWRQVGAATLVGLLVLSLTTSAVAWAWQVVAARGTGEPSAVLALGGRASPVPALGLELQRPPQRAAVLVLQPHAEGLEVRLWRGDGDQLDEQATVIAARLLSGPPGAVEVVPPDAAEQALADLVAAMSVGAAGNPSEELARHAVAVVLVPPGDDGPWERLVAQLDATTGLERVTQNATGTVWRVAPPEGSALIGRARVVSADGTVTTVVASDGVRAGGGVPAGEAERMVVLAERADSGWRAWLDGAPLRSRTLGWQQAFDLGPGGGDLVVAHTSWRLTLVHTVQAVVLGLFALLALPLRRRRGEAV